MAIAVSLLFDPEVDGAVRRVWQALADNGICSAMDNLGYAPHVSLIVSDDDDLAMSLSGAIAAMAGERGLDLSLGPARQFPDTSIVWLACDGGAALFDLQKRIADVVPVDRIRPHYRPGQWTPHVTVEMAGDAAEGLRHANQLWPEVRKARSVRLELAQFMPVRPLSGVDLAD